MTAEGAIGARPLRAAILFAAVFAAYAALALMAWTWFGAASTPLAARPPGRRHDEGGGGPAPRRLAGARGGVRPRERGRARGRLAFLALPVALAPLLGALVAYANVQVLGDATDAGEFVTRW